MYSREMSEETGMGEFHSKLNLKDEKGEMHNKYEEAWEKVPQVSIITPI